MKQNYAVIGHPIGHTMSPFIHYELFKIQGLQVEYSVFDIEPSNLKNSLKTSLSELNGFNVTIPHKEAIIPFIDNIHPSAAKYNAVNCVLKKDGKLYGYSTDAFGFTKALENQNVKLEGKVLVLGAGGAARTLAREAADKGCEITIAARQSGMQRASLLKEWLSEKTKATVTVTQIDNINGNFNLLINATPVGMYPNPDAMPVSEETLCKCESVFDAIYNPQETQLIASAKAHGLKVVGGMDMLVWQAVKAHEYWYGATFDENDIDDVIERANREMTRIFYEK